MPAEIASYSVFQEVAFVNQAHTRFESHGKGSGNRLGMRCPNYHHPDLVWAHALHSDDGLEYNPAHHISSEATTLNDGVDERMLTALAAACFYGTEYYADGIHVDKSTSCPVEEAPDHTTTDAKTTETKLQSTSAQIPGATRYNYGDIGVFDVSAFPDGDGFVVKHVDSNELLEVSIFNDNSESPDGGKVGTVVLVVLTVPHVQWPSESHHSSRNADTSSFLSLTRKLSGGGIWRGQRGRMRDESGTDESSDEEEAKPELVDQRHVVGTSSSD
jgi:hypothetical protein